MNWVLVFRASNRLGARCSNRDTSLDGGDFDFHGRLDWYRLD